MKRIFIAAAVAASAGLTAQAQNLVAGWDFSQYYTSGVGTTDGLALTSTLSANYSAFDATNGLGAESSAFGTLYYDGTNGSSDAGIDGTNDAIWPTSGSLVSNINAGGTGGFDNHALLDLEGQTFSEHLSLLSTTAVNLVFQADLGSVAMQGSDWTVSLGALVQSGSASIGVDFSTDGVNYTNVGSFNLTSLDTAYSLALSGDSSTEAFVRLNLSGAGIQIDNVAITAAAAAIPEPSTYVAFAGLLALGYAGYRRRRRA